MKSAAGAFLGSAASRLLPATIPFRFFGAALVYHVLAWLALLAGAQQWPHFGGGLGWPLAALHVFTLGVIVMTAIGASLQLLPVATRQPVLSERLPRLIWWLYVPAVAALTLGMGLELAPLLAAGALAIVGALLLYALLLVANLRGARGMPGVVSHGWAALGCLAVALASALALVGNYVSLPSLGRPAALALHVAFAGYGFMGLLALGLSAILVPMFTLSPLPDARRHLTSCAFAVVGLGCAAAAALGNEPRSWRIAAIGAGTIAVALHLALMQAALRDGMRHDLGRSFVLVKIAWVALAASLLAALAIALGTPLPGLASLFGLLLVGAWLLTFTLAMLQRILPFLASMHAARGRRRPPLPSTFSTARPLAIHFACHLAALAGLALALATESSALAALAAATGAVGAIAYLAFYIVLLRRLSAPAPAPAGSRPPVAGEG